MQSGTWIIGAPSIQLRMSLPGCDLSRIGRQGWVNNQTDGGPFWYDKRISLGLLLDVSVGLGRPSPNVRYVQETISNTFTFTDKLQFYGILT